MLGCRSLSGLYHWLFSFPFCERLEVELLSWSWLHPLSTRLSFKSLLLGHPASSSALLCQEGNVWHFTTELWSYLYALEAENGQRRNCPIHYWRSDDILNLNTTLAPAKIKNTQGFQKWPWKLWSLKIHSCSLEPSLSWVRRRDSERKAHELFCFAYCCPWDKMLLATQECLDLSAKEEGVLLWSCPITWQHLKLFQEKNKKKG